MANGDQQSNHTWFWYILAGVVLLAVVVTFAYAVIEQHPILEALKDKEYARGVITFIFSFGTISLAFVLILMAIFSNASADQFRRAREVFAALTGILGTIVGFYFGAATQDRVELVISEVRLQEMDDSAKILAYVSGGQPPYRYTVKFEDSSFETIEERATEGGWIFEQLIKIPTGEVTVEVKDRDNQHATGRAARTSETSGQPEENETAPPGGESP
jgi:magnesium-transporting ATPase (P-type)